MSTDWDSHKKHRAQVVADFGQWIGLLDENGQPICDLPQPLTMTAPRGRGSVGSFQATFDLGDETGGLSHPAVRALIDDTMGVTDGTGHVTPTSHTRIIVIERATGRRQAYEVAQRKSKTMAGTHHVMEINGADMVGKLSRIPIMSMPASWTALTGNYAWADITNAWADADITIPMNGDYEAKRITLAKRATGGFTQGGTEPGEQTLWRVLDESIRAAFTLAGTRAGIVAVKPETSLVDPMLIKPSDGDVWTELSARATAAGITISSDWWFPGDPQPTQADNAPALTDSTLLIRVEATA